MFADSILAHLTLLAANFKRTNRSVDSFRGRVASGCFSVSIDLDTMLTSPHLDIWLWSLPAFDSVTPFARLRPLAT